MTTVLFIHGTGVREQAFARTFARVKAGLEGVRPDIGVERCYWGVIGASLQANGKSFYFDSVRPKKAKGKSSRRGHGEEPVPEQEKELARWARLLVDPLFEIRLYQVVGEFAGPPSGDLFGTPLPDRVRALPTRPQVAAELASSGLIDAFTEAVGWVTGSDAFAAAFGEASTVDGNTERMLARALVARCLATAAEDGTDLAGDRRDGLVAAVVAGFGIADYGIGEITDTLGDWAKNAAYRTAQLPLRRRRRAMIDQTADIILYQSHGDAIRGFVRDRIKQLSGPVVLIAHSLGGIVAFDLLTADYAGALDQVQMLVTVGSQVPLFYELGALSGAINYPVPLPDGFPPRWVNVYDERDLLGYAGAELFPRRCQDIKLDTGTPFPTAHGAYWDDTTDLYRRLADALHAEGL